jgi:hypothetical protein
MFRIVFWILVILGLAAFFGIAATHRHMTPDQITLFFGSVVLICFAALSSGIFYLFYRGWRTGVVIPIGKYGNRTGRTFSRNLQPVKYWIYMILYFLWSLAYVYIIFRAVPVLWQSGEHIFLTPPNN